MKILMIPIIIVGMCIAQKNQEPNNLSTQNNHHDFDSSRPSSLSSVLEYYLGIKDALVSSDPSQAAAQAGMMLNNINSLDVASLPSKDSKAFSNLKDKLAFDARHISEVKDIEHQREHFASLSQNMFKLAKATRLSDKTLYQDYCPMKKSYWLSTDEEIKNPYYGKQMLSCGNIIETLK